LIGRDPDAALPCFRRAVERARDPERRAVAVLRLAETLAANGYPDEAAARFRDVPPGPLAPCADYGLGALAAARGDTAEARQLLSRCADSPFTRRKAAVQLAAVARRLGEADPPRPDPPADVAWPDPFLETCMARAVGRDSRLAWVNALEQQGKRGEALVELRSIARQHPDPQVHLALGITLGRAGQYSESEAALRKCLDQEPDLVRAQYYLSLALFGQAEALRNQGRTAEASAGFEEAARWARRATELAPQNGEAHFQLGLAEWCLDHRAEAVRSFRRTVTTRPDLADGHLWLGRALAADGQMEEAIQHLRDAVKYAPAGDPRARQVLSRALEGKTP